MPPTLDTALRGTFEYWWPCTVQQNLLLPLLNLSLLAEHRRIFPRCNSWEDSIRNHRRFGELVACYLSNHKAPRGCALSCGFWEPICRSGFICPIIALMLSLMCHASGFSEALKKKKKSLFTYGRAFWRRTPNRDWSY